MGWLDILARPIGNRLAVKTFSYYLVALWTGPLQRRYMPKLAFIATLFFLLPSFITVVIETDLFGPSFQRLSEEIPIMWSDGEVRLEEGKVVISVGEKSSLLVYSEGKILKFLSNVKETVELSEPNIFISITTKKDKVDFGEVKDSYSCVNDVVTLRIIEREPIIRVVHQEKSIKTENVFKSTESHQVSNRDFDFILEKDRAPVENNSKTPYKSVGYFNEHLPQLLNDIKTNKVDKETIKEISEQDSISNKIVNTKVQSQPLQNNLKGEQFKFDKFDEPFIYISSGIVKMPQFINSLTGHFFQTTRKWRPYTGEHRIPDETKLLIVNEGDSVKYYKNITRESKVWYLKRNEKVFYPCIVENFSLYKRNPTLKCIFPVCESVPEVSWDDIFPIESTDLIRGMGEFLIKDEDIVWDDLSEQKQKETEETLPEERKKRKRSKALPRKRKNNGSSNNEEAHLKEQCVDGEGEAGVNNNLESSNNIISNCEYFYVGDQLFHVREDSPPLIFLSICEKGENVEVLDSATGKIRKLVKQSVKLSAQPSIPIETKISEDRKLKIILPNSHVLYRNSDGIYYPCIARSFQYGTRIQINCVFLGVLTPFWDHLFPIEALPTLPESIKIHGFGYKEAVNLEDLERFINKEIVVMSTVFPRVFDPEMESIFASENTIEDYPETEGLLDFINDDIPLNMNVVGLDTLDTLIEETEGNNDQKSLRNDPVDAEVQLQLSGKYVKGEQFNCDGYDEPFIYISSGIVKMPQFINSLTGHFFQMTRKWRPYTGEHRIPDETKLLIVNEGDSVKYYKNITRKSRVWYLRRDENVFYPCIVEKFSRNNRKPTLKCIGHEPETVPKVSWNDIFPIESTELIRDLGKFIIQIEDINWGIIIPRKSL